MSDCGVLRSEKCIILHKVLVLYTSTKRKNIIRTGLKDATKTSLSIFKIMLPLSLLMAILNYLGAINVLSTLLQPITNLLGLRGEGIPVPLFGYLINTYSAIALMLSLNLSLKELSILSAMILLAHTLPV